MKRIWCSRSPWGRLRTGLAAAAFLMPLAACGGSSNEQPTSTPQPAAGPAANTHPQARHDTRYERGNAQRPEPDHGRAGFIPALSQPELGAAAGAGDDEFGGP